MRVAADALSARRTRVEFRNWLETHFRLGAERLYDLVLAVSEAIANAAEFAYVETSREKGRDSLEQSIARWERVSPKVFEVA